MGWLILYLDFVFMSEVAQKLALVGAQYFYTCFAEPLDTATGHPFDKLAWMDGYSAFLCFFRVTNPVSVYLDIGRDLNTHCYLYTYQYQSVMWLL